MNRFTDKNLKEIKTLVSASTGASFGRPRPVMMMRRLVITALIVAMCTAGAFAAYRISLSRNIMGDNERMTQEGNFFISMPFGSTINPGGYEFEHKGIDYPAPFGTPVLAAQDGTVTEADYSMEHGNYVLIDHGDGYSTIYAHLEEIETEVGAAVRKGDEIGTVGSSGRSTGPHLHFGLFVNGEAVDPEEYWED